MLATQSDLKDARSGPSLYICWQSAMALFCLAYLLLTLYGSYHTRFYESMAQNFAFALTAGFTAIVLIQPGLRRRWDMRLLILFCLWVLIAEVKGYTPADAGYAFTVYHALFYALVCFPLALVLPDALRRKLIHGLLHVFLAASVILCAVSVYAALRQINIPSFDGAAMAGLDATLENRLFMFMHPNRAGLLCNLTILLAIYLGLSSSRLIIRGYAVVVVVVAGIALALTDSRANFLTVSACVGLLGFLYIRKRFAGTAPVRRLLAGAAVAAVVAVLCFAFFSLPVLAVGKLAPVLRLPPTPSPAPAPTPTQLVLVSMTTPGPSPDSDPAPTDEPAHATDYSQQAESPSSGDQAASDLPIMIVSDHGEYLHEDAQPLPDTVQVTQARDLGSDLSDLNGRLEVWRAGFEAIRRTPSLLLWGTTYERSMEKVIMHSRHFFAHLHNSFLQVLISVGLPGLCLLVMFLALLLISGLRLFGTTDPSVGLGERFLPVALVSFLIIAMVESVLFISGFRLFDPLFFIIAGYVTSLAARGKRGRPDPVSEA